MGNWVGDEILYHARIHPEQYSDTFSEEEVGRLYESLMYVTKTAVDALGDSEGFPEEWMFKHRWGKGKKGKEMRLPSGERIVFLTVGGRTSCVVPEVQRKTGPVLKDVDVDVDEEAVKGSKGKKRRKSAEDEDDEEVSEEETPPQAKAKSKPRTNKAKAKVEAKKPKAEESEPQSKSKPTSKTKKAKVKAEEPEVEEEEEAEIAYTSESKKPKATKGRPTMKEESEVPSEGRRRSGRVSKRGE